MESPVAYIAHIGDRIDTLTQFDEKKIIGIETDVRMTSDGVVVIKHNRRVLGIFGRYMWIERMTYDELTKRFESPLITLHEFIQQTKKKFPQKKKYLLEVDIKQYFIEKEVLEVLTTSGAFSHFSEIIISSPDIWVLRTFADLNQNVTLALTDAPLDKWDLWDLKAYRYVVLFLQYTLRPLMFRVFRRRTKGKTMPVANVFHQIVTKKLVTFLHEQDIRVHAYGAHKHNHIQRLIGAGADVVKIKSPEFLKTL